MQVLLGIFIGIAGILLVLSIRLLTTFFHEMGHAIPALLFTNKPVKVFIGTYGSIDQSTPITIGRLQLYLRLALFDWKIGMCQHDGRMRIWQHFLLILGGPIASLLIAIPLLILIAQQNLSEGWFAFALLLLVAAIIDFLVNIIPVDKAIDMYDGSATYNDGYQLFLLMGRLSYSDEYLALEEKFEQKDYQTLIPKAQDLIAKGNAKAEVYDLLIQALVATKEYEQAIHIMEQSSQHYTMRYKDYALLGDLYLKTNQYDRAIKCFHYCISKRYNDPNVLSKRAMVHLHYGEYQEALLDLNGAIEYAPANSNYLAKRAYINTLQKDFTSARVDLENAINLDDSNAHTHFYQGVYFENQNEYSFALEAYNKAKDLKIEEHSLDYRINKMEQQVHKMNP